MRIITIPSFQREDFEKKLVAINKKLNKLSHTSEIEILLEDKTTGGVYSPELGKVVNCQYDILSLSLPVDTKTYVGTVSFTKGVKSIFSVNDTNLTSDDIKSSRCDHCNTNRARNKVHVFNIDNKLVVVGNTCVDEFTGMNIDKVLHHYISFCNDLEESSLSFIKSNNFLYHFETVMDTIKIAMTECPEYVKAGSSMVSSKDRFDRIHSESDSFKQLKNEEIKKSFKYTNEQIKDILIENYGSLDETSSNFNSNIKSALFYPNGNTVRDIMPCKLRGIVVWAVYNALTEKVEKKPETNEHVGKVGQKLSVDGVIEGLKELDDIYNRRSFLVTVRTEDDNIVKFFSSSAQVLSSSVGEHIEIEGMVSKHETWKERKSTMIKKPVVNIKRPVHA